MKQRAILFELHHLGDAVLSLPFVRAAIKDYELHVVCRGGSREVFRSWLPEAQIHCWEPFWECGRGQKWASSLAFFRLLKVCRSLRPALAATVWADARVHLLLQATGAPIRIGFPVNTRNFYAHERPWRKRRMRLGQLLGVFGSLTRSLQRADYQQAHLEDWRQLTLAAGLPWNVEVPWFPPAAVPAEKLGWVIHPGGRLPTKRWPVERFEALLRDHLADLEVIVIQPPDSPAPALYSPRHRLVQTPDFAALAAVLGRAECVLCNDSLVSHLAAALGKKVFTIFGSGNPNWFAPFANERRVLASDVCPFRPCIDRCVQPSVICLESVSVEQVAACLRG